MHEKSLVSWTILLSAYAQAGDFDRAARIFSSEMPATNLFSWNVMLGASLKSGGNFRSAIQLLERFPEYDIVSGNTMLKASSSFGHCFSPKSCFDWMEWHDIISWTLLLSFYLQEKTSVTLARRVHESMPEHDITSATMLLAAYIENLNVDLAIDLFHNIPFHDLVSSNAMLSGYGRLGKVDEAEKLFYREMCEKDSSSWNAMLFVYAINDCTQHFEDLIHIMPDLTPTSVCAFLNNCRDFLDFHKIELVVSKLPEHDVLSATSIILAYAQRGHLPEAEETFNTMLSRNLVSLNVMLAALVNNICLTEARYFFDYSMPEHDIVSCTTLATAYAENNHQSEVLKLLRVDVHDAISTSVVLNSSVNAVAGLHLEQHCRSSQFNNSLHVLATILIDGFDPNEMVIVNILNACSHQGDVLACRWYFQTIYSDQDMAWTRQIFSCLIDMLARSGNLEEAKELVDSMPFLLEFEDWTCLAWEAFKKN